ncbi:Hypothetical predicted protein [Octopus vulgaris]|uniref:Uncharacterized protein n=1 Tax=Octopus vulgaris TaxID=6645 RepID=A0AA36B5Z0_OCTVU|nr:Hypothetical predicted protein [Octopus vulgaris]
MRLERRAQDTRRQARRRQNEKENFIAQRRDIQRQRAAQKRQDETEVQAAQRREHCKGANVKRKSKQKRGKRI